MQVTPSSKEFVFLNAQPALTSSVKQIVEHAQKCLKDAYYLDDTFFKIKSVATELISNACKHAGTETVNFEILIDNDYITIKKTEKGHPFKAIAHGQLRSEKKLLAYDIMHKLYAISGVDNIIQFIAEDSNDNNPDINEVAEHFGLLIITKCAEEFLYHYNEHTGLNTFIVKIAIGD